MTEEMSGNPINCEKCHKHADGYILGKNEAKTTQCNSCMFDGRRECMYHGYPEETIPCSCEYKIGTYAVIAPIEAQLHNKEHEDRVRAKARADIHVKLIESFFNDPVGRHPNSDEVFLMDEILGRIDSLFNDHV